MLKKICCSFFGAFLFLVVGSAQVSAQVMSVTPQATSSATIITPVPTLSPTPTVRPDLTQKSEETVGPFEKLLLDQKLGPTYLNPLKYTIRGAVASGVPANTIVLLLLVPVIATFIAAARHIVGIRGFGIFLPAALSVTFLAMGPFMGILLFLVIVLISSIVRMALKVFKIRLQYLPRMALILWGVVLGVLGILFLAPFVGGAFFANISIFPVLILVLLAEDFTKVQLGKSVRTAIQLTGETLMIALLSYIFMTTSTLQNFAIREPEILLLAVAFINIIMGRYIGLRLREYWRFRKLIKS